MENASLRSQPWRLSVSAAQWASANHQSDPGDSTRAVSASACGDHGEVYGTRSRSGPSLRTTDTSSPS